MSPQFSRDQGKDKQGQPQAKQNEPLAAESMNEPGEDAEHGISSLVDEYLATVRVRRTISGQPVALPVPSTPRPQPVVTDETVASGSDTTVLDSSIAPASRESGNRRRDAEQDLANLRRRANMLVQTKQYAEALNLFQRVYMLGNNDDSALYWMGECEYHIGNLVRAKELLEQYISIREGNVDRSVLARLTVIRRNLAAQNRTAGGSSSGNRKPPIFRRVNDYEDF